MRNLMKTLLASVAFLIIILGCGTDIPNPFQPEDKKSASKKNDDQTTVASSTDTDSETSEPLTPTPFDGEYAVTLNVPTSDLKRLGRHQKARGIEEELNLFGALQVEGGQARIEIPEVDHVAIEGEFGIDASGRLQGRFELKVFFISYALEWKSTRLINNVLRGSYELPAGQGIPEFTGDITGVRQSYTPDSLSLSQDVLEQIRVWDGSYDMQFTLGNQTQNFCMTVENGVIVSNTTSTVVAGTFEVNGTLVLLVQLPNQDPWLAEGLIEEESLNGSFRAGESIGQFDGSLVSGCTD